MDDHDKVSVDGKRWRRLCELVATESDPQRLSELLNQLVKELDARREALRESGKRPNPTASDS